MLRANGVPVRDHGGLVRRRGFTAAILGGGVSTLLFLAGAPSAMAQDGQVRALIEARQHAVLSSEIAGRISHIAVETGQSFKAGQVLIAFDCSSYQAELDAARAQLNAAEVTARVNRQLNNLRSIGGAEVQLAEAKAQVARADVRKSEIQTRRCEIKAPFDGRAVERRIQEHESVAPGTPLLEILSDRDLKVELIVPSAWLVWLRPGQNFELRIDETGISLPAEVVRPGARVDPASQSVKVTARLRDGAGEGGVAASAGLVAGMSGTAIFPLPTKPGAAP